MTADFHRMGGPSRGRRRTATTRVRRWHWCRWTKWGEPFPVDERTYVGWYQDRTCNGCNRRQRRTVDAY